MGEVISRFEHPATTDEKIPMESGGGSGGEGWGWEEVGV